MSPSAIIFDCDGTLADSMPLHWKAWQAVARTHGFVFPEEEFYANGGVPTWMILDRIGREQGIDMDSRAVAIEKEESYLELLDGVEPNEAVVAVARRHHGRIPMAVASGGTRAIIGRVLSHLAIDHLFEAVVTSEDVERQKPAPDIFLEAARRLGVPPRECVGYEDTDLGMQAIADAGMRAIDVRNLPPSGGLWKRRIRARVAERQTRQT